MHTSIVSILFVVKKVNFSRFFKVFSSAPIFSILSSVNLNKVCHQLKSCHQHLPDVGQILKNKINSDFFWFCYSCFPKSRNICRPIIFAQVHRPIPSTDQSGRPGQGTYELFLYYDIKIILKFVLILKQSLSLNHFARIDLSPANHRHQMDNYEVEDFSNFALVSEGGRKKLRHTMLFVSHFQLSHTA